MFFIIGISRGKKKLDYMQSLVCSNCSSFGRYEIFMTYTYLTLFFIPILKWSTHYYVTTTCCGKVYELNATIGKMIRKGKDTTIHPKDLTSVSSYKGPANYSNANNNTASNHTINHCPTCGYSISRDFAYCPKCGKQI